MDIKDIQLGGGETWFDKSDIIISITKNRTDYKNNGRLTFQRNRYVDDENIFYIIDTPFNRDKMICAFGKPKLFYDDMCYIKFDKLDLSWRTTFTNEWLYREPPLLTDIEEILKTFKK